MTSVTHTQHVAPGIDAREQARRDFAEEFAIAWEDVGSPRMDGRILGYLMVMDAPYISSSDLAAVLNASAGSVSMSTRRMVEAGFIRRHAIAGDRSHYFRADRDPWGSFLAGERGYLGRLSKAIEDGLTATPLDEEAAQTRLTNAKDYMNWLAGYHRTMLAEWEAFKARRDAAAPQITTADKTTTG